MARLTDFLKSKYHLYTVGIIVYNFLLAFIDEFFIPGIPVIIRIISLVVIEPIYLVVLNYIFLFPFSIKNGLKRYIIMLFVLCINLLVSVFAFRWGIHGILGLPVKCMIVDPMSLVIVTLYSGAAIILLTFEWTVAIFIKKLRKKKINNH